LKAAFSKNFLVWREYPCKVSVLDIMKKPDSPDHPTGDTFQPLRQQLLKESGSVYIMVAAALWPIVSGILCWAIMRPGWEHSEYSALAVLAGVFGPTIALGVISSDFHNHKRKPILDALTRLDDPRVVDLLLTRIPYPTPGWSAHVRPMLIRVLPHLQRADTKHLSLQAQDVLNTFLELQDPELILAILTALPHLGTVSALPYVAPHAKGATRPGRDPRIREAAQECYAILTARVDSVTGKGPDKTLLRAASAPADTSILLRPATSGETTPPEQLLRAQSQP